MLAEQKKKSVEPPPSSDESNVKTRERHVRTRVDGNKRQPASQRLTSPVPLVPSSDHSPGWLPPASRREPAFMSGALEIVLAGEEAHMLEQLASDQALSPSD